MAVERGDKVYTRLTDEGLAERFEEWEGHFDSRAEAVREALDDGIDLEGVDEDDDDLSGVVDGMFALTAAVLIALLGQSALFWGLGPALVLGLASTAAFGAGTLIPYRELFA